MPELPVLRYDADLIALGRYAARFRALGPDAERDAWLARYLGDPHGVVVTKLAGWLDTLLTSYEVHGLLGAYPMHLLSSQAWGELLGERRGALLDVGAGAGYVTEGARPHFDEIVCTETSHFLRRRLARRGFRVHARDLTTEQLGRSFDVVSCFNVLDRTARPLGLLRGLLAHLAPRGRLLLSMPLPVSAHVHVPGGTVSASERLPASARSWEGAVCELSETLIERAGLTVERIARVPYLSRGDPGQDLYVLDAAVWVSRYADDAPNQRDRSPQSDHSEVAENQGRIAQRGGCDQAHLPWHPERQELGKPLPELEPSLLAVHDPLRGPSAHAE